MIAAQLAAARRAATCRRSRPARRCERCFAPNGEAYVDLSREIVAGHMGGVVNEALTVFAIVNAITSICPTSRPCRSSSTATKWIRSPGTSICVTPCAQVARLGAERTVRRHDSISTDARADAPRLAKLTPDFIVHAEGSVLIEVGRRGDLHRVASRPRVPPFLRGMGKGWVTAEYGMLPRATSTRTTREASAGKVGGRTQEIQRLIGRSLRSVTSMNELGERTIWIDCDVLQADGGTRTAAITGGFVALVLASSACANRACSRACPCPITSPRPASASSRARRCWTWRTTKTRRRTST